MATVTARGAASVSAIGERTSDSFSTSTPAGWAMIWWGLAVLTLLFFLWAL
jgi:hypothetical protein